MEKNLEIRHGNMSFHFNRKLCLHLIRKFEKNVKMAPNAQNDIGNTTNGDQAACMLLRNHFFLFLFISVDTGMSILILNILKCDQEHKKKLSCI